MAGIKWGSTYHYFIQGFHPPAPDDNRMAGWSFSIALDPAFAAAAKAMPLRERLAAKLERFAPAWGDLCAGYGAGSIPRVNFWDDTLLLTNVSVPGNACGLDIDREHFDRLGTDHPPLAVDYGPHNVDSMGQAAGLLSIWLEWFQGALACLSEK